MSPRSHRPLSAIGLLAAFCFACGSDDDPPSSGSQADAAMLPPIDAAPPPPDAEPIDAGADAAPLLHPFASAV